MRLNTAYQLELNTLNVVVIEDNRAMQSLFRSMISQIGVMKTRVFENPEDALGHMLNDPPNLIVADWKMAPLTGAQVVRAIRHKKMEPLCFVPVLIVTGHATLNVVERVYRAGAQYCLVKPVSPNQLARGFRRITNDYRQLILEKDYYHVDGVAAALKEHVQRRTMLAKAKEHKEMALSEVQEFADQVAMPRTPPPEKWLPNKVSGNGVANPKQHLHIKA